MQLNTTLGNMEVKPIKGTVKAIINGLWYNGDITVTYFTSEDERAGVNYTYNVKTKQLVKKERIKVSFISYESALKYGRKVVKETLPIYLTK
jgi:hypothetical protein